MLTVKIQKTELESGDIPPLCMVCGDKDAETKIPYTARKIFFPLSMFGIIGKYLTPKRYDMTVLSCSGCKEDFVYEQNMSNVWLSLRLLAVCSLFYVLLADSENAPGNLLIPIFIVGTTLVLEAIYFWTKGRKNAIRLVNLDEKSVSLDLPNEAWPAAYTKLRREKEMARHRQRSGAPPV